ncbi:MAG TPA: hypothetical protein VKE27_01170, partial [Candidatus Dormibacteraeota bacterium]|nr:hypothetical protein [Candidatus Dormibacteraeota bacterium]
MAQAIKSTGAELVHWNLNDLFASPDDPEIESWLAHDLESATSFETKYRGKVVELSPRDFAEMMRELGEYEESAAKPEVYAYMLHSQNT